MFFVPNPLSAMPRDSGCSCETMCFVKMEYMGDPMTHRPRCRKVLPCSVHL